MSSLQSLVTTNRAAAVSELAGVIDAEVSDQSGLSGAAVKAAYGTAQKVKPGVVESATDKLLPEFVTALTPFWDTKPAGTGFGDHLAANSDAAAEALLAVTDAQVGDAKPALAKAYGTLRGKAKNYVVNALPRVGAAVEKHA